MQTIIAKVLIVMVIGARISADVCKKCICEEDRLDCSNLSLEDHFNGAEWNGTVQTLAFLDLNNIGILKAFPKLPFTKLSVTHNMIVKIDQMCFKELDNLTELDLSYNHLTSEQLTPSVFKGRYAPQAYEPLNKLRVLRLSANALHSLDADLFEHLPNLQELSLDYNPLRIIDRQTTIALTSIDHLKVLDLSSTGLSSFPDHLLHTPRYLEVLNLSKNLFLEPPQSLGDSHHLKQLYFDGNPLVSLKTFPSLPYLEVLSLSWSPALREIEPHSLSNLSYLHEFYCSHNHKLEHISGNTFSKPVVGVPDGEVWPPLKKLTLNNNNLGYLAFELVAHWERLELIDIRNNPWVCECHNQWLVSTLVPTMEKLNSSNHNVEGIVCHNPEAMRGQSIADLDHRSYHMRCLDLYDHHPENDATLLVGILIGVILAVPLTMLVIISYKKHLHTTAAQYHRAFYKRGDSLHEFVTNRTP